MNNILNENLSALAEWYPELADRLKEIRHTEQDIIVDSLESWDNEIIFRVEKDNNSLYLGGKRNVKKPLDLWYERYNNINKHAPIILLGIGSGIYLKKIIKETPKTVNVIVYEPSPEIFLKLMETVDLVDTIRNRAIIFIIKDINDSDFGYAIDRLITIETIEHLKVEIHPNYRMLFPDDILERTREINKRTDFLIVNEKTGVAFSTVSARNQLINMQYVIDGYNTKKLVDVIPYENRAAILVSAGPSLNKNIEELKKAKNHIFILAVDTAIKPLVKAGIIPDAMITIDGKKPLKLVDIDGADEIPIITSVTGNCDFVGHQKGKKILYYDGYILPQEAYLSVGKVLPSVYFGGSVACIGFSLLYMMGFNKIILVGQDLAFTNNRSHADGTFEEIMPEEKTEGMLLVKGNYEEKVPTRGDFKLYLDWFEDTIKKMQEARNTIVINATEGGAYIKGTEIMKLKDAIKTNSMEYIDFSNCIENMESVFSETDKIKVTEFILSIPGEFVKTKNNIKELISFYKKIEGLVNSKKLDSDKYIKYLKKIKKITNKIENSSIYQLISSTLSYAEWIVRSESLVESDDIEEEAKLTVEQGLKLCELMLESTTLLEECADELVKIVHDKYPVYCMKAKNI